MRNVSYISKSAAVSGISGFMYTWVAGDDLWCNVPRIKNRIVFINKNYYGIVVNFFVSFRLEVPYLQKWKVLGL